MSRDEAASTMTGEQQRAALDPTALSLADAVRLLSRVGGQPITEAMLRGDAAAGAPLNADGSMNLVHYTAWLLREGASGR
jgi:hypothetical protein